MEEITPSDDIQKQERPQFLSVLCVLTFIASGFGSFGCLLLFFFGKTLKNFVENSPEMPEGAMNNIDVLDNTTFWFLSLLLVLTSLYGAIKMFKLKKIGFHLYASANILAIILPLIYGIEFSIFSLFTTAGFIAMYAANLKYMS